MPVSSFSVCAAPNSRPSAASQHEGEESPTARRELQLLEDHRPWEMLDNMALAMIDQTYAAVLEILRLPPPPPQEGDRHVTLSVSQCVGSTDPDSPVIRVEASAKHCCIYVIDGFHVGGDIIGRELAKHASPGQRSSWPSRHRLTRASIGASLGTLYLRVPPRKIFDSFSVRRLNTDKDNTAQQ
uniref:Uncharacterized protein n=1 Tax=Setaria viridis TaxID=4556 RepID=A0A4U6VYJ1_SETVI|nr:hypothetical protein SEVIR_2G348500v2 [Setaria viridis]